MIAPAPLNLGELELAVLESVWRAGEADVRQVHADLAGDRAIASNTVQSTLDRLHRKRLLTRSKVRHAYVYRAAVDRAGLLSRAIETAVQQLNCHATNTALAAFVDFAARTDRATLLELERLVAARIDEEKEDK